MDAAQRVIARLGIHKVVEPFVGHDVTIVLIGISAKSTSRVF